MNQNEANPPKTIAILDYTDAPLLASDEDWQRCAETLQARLHHPVQTLRAQEDQDLSEAYAEMIQWYGYQGYQRFLILPCGTQDFELNVLAGTVAWLRQESSDHSDQASIEVYVGDPPSLCEIAEMLYSIASEEHLSDIVLLSSFQPRQGAYPYEASSLQQEWLLLCDRVQKVSCCFVGDAVSEASPVGLEAVLSQHSEGNTLWVPWRLGAEDFTNVRHRINRSGSRILGSDRIDTKDRESFSGKFVPLLEYPAWLHLLLNRYLVGLSARSVERYFSIVNGEAMFGKDGEGLRLLDRRIDGMLPSEYRGKTEQVPPTSMGSAGLKLDPFGRVAWDEIWTSYCDLALAGGPPHRGKLLEAVSAQQASEDIDSYHSVASEIRRGIEMVTGLTTQESASLGWIGVVCDSETMAAWLMRAIIVENVMVRREGNILYLPAGPAFTIKREVKNVITSVAKTVHYYRAHLRQTI